MKVAKEQYPPVPAKKRRKRELSERAKDLIGDAVSTLPGRLQTRLEQLGWSKKTLAQESGISASVISRSPVGMNLRTAIALARAMKVPVGWLVAAEGKPPRRGPPASADFVETEHVAHGEEKGEGRSSSNVAPRSSRPGHHP